MNLSTHHAPYIRHPESSRTMMGDMIIALVPLYFMAYFYYGSRIFLLGATAVTTCLLCSWLCDFLLHRRVNFRDMSSVVTGLIISMMMPPTINFSIVVFASMFAILVAKAPFGGTGHNIFNPAAAGLAFAFICWNSQMFLYTKPLQKLPITITENVALLQGPTATLKLGGVPRIGLTEMLLGNYPGPIGSTYALIIFSCLVYLIARKTIQWYMPISYILPIALMAAFKHPYLVSPSESIMNELFVGSLFFVAVYMVSDPATSPKYRISRILYGLSASVLTMLFRYYSPLELSSVFAVLLMNALAPAFDSFCEWLMPHLHRAAVSASQGGNES